MPLYRVESATCMANEDLDKIPKRRIGARPSVRLFWQPNSDAEISSSVERECARCDLCSERFSA